MGVQLWQARHRSAFAQNHSAGLENISASTHDNTVNDVTFNDAADKESDWSSLEQNVAACTACSLCKTRKQTVFGVGSHQAKLLIIGEAPGAQEDLQGEPFVGRAGQLLDAMLRSIGLNRQQIYIANILKCRPPSNRDPEASEVTCCTPFLQQQIALLQPKLILAVGRIAAHYLLNTSTPLSRMRGQEYSYGENRTPLLVTFHPAYLLRSPREKAKAYEDLQKVIKRIYRLQNDL
jgi:DNA polymerase